MNQDLEDNWNSIVLKVATSGGFMVTEGSKYRLYITDYIIEERTDQYHTVFKDFLISKTEYNKILKEALSLKDELYIMNEADKAKKEAAKKRKSRTTKTKNTRNKTAKN